MAQTGFLYDGSRSEGYNVHHPYKPCNVFQRIIREIVFRFFPFLSDLFYNTPVRLKYLKYLKVPGIVF